MWRIGTILDGDPPSLLSECESALVCNRTAPQYFGEREADAEREALARLREGGFELPWQGLREIDWWRK